MHASIQLIFSFFQKKKKIFFFNISFNYSASNIFIYSIFGHKFRRICAALLCPCIVNRNYKRMNALGLNELTNQLWNKLSNQTVQVNFLIITIITYKYAIVSRMAKCIFHQS